jgi:hypothetical protein
MTDEDIRRIFGRALQATYHVRPAIFIEKEPGLFYQLMRRLFGAN